MCLLIVAESIFGRRGGLCYQYWSSTAQSSMSSDHHQLCSKNKFITNAVLEKLSCLFHTWESLKDAVANHQVPGTSGIASPCGTMQYTNLTRSVPSVSARGHAHAQSNNTQQKEKYKHTCMYKIFHRLPCSVRLGQAQPNTNMCMHQVYLLEVMHTHSVHMCTAFSIDCT